LGVQIKNKEVMKNAVYTSVIPPVGVSVTKVSFSQGYNHIHVFNSGEMGAWGVALSEEAVTANMNEDGTFDFNGDGILSAEIHYGLTVSMPKIRSVYLISASQYNANKFRLAASDSAVFPYAITGE